MNESAISSSSVSRRAGHPMRNESYRRWLLGSSVSLFGDQFYLVALPWLVLRDLDAPTLLGTVMMAGALPRAVLMLIGGTISDLISARRIMILSAAVRTVCVAIFGLLAWGGMLSIWEVYALVIVFGVADAFAIPAQQAYIPTLLGAEQLVAGMSLAHGVEISAYTLGPLPAGLTIAHFGAAAALLLDAVSFLFVIGALIRLPDPSVAHTRTDAVKAFSDGIRYVLDDVPLRALLFLVAAANLCTLGAATVGFAHLASLRLGSSTAYGIVLSAGATGSLIGTLAAGMLKVQRRGVVILACLAIVGIGLMSVPFVPGLWGVSAVHGLIGMASGLFMLTVMAWIMQRVDASVRGRVSGVMMLASFGMAPISMAASGSMANWSIDLLFVLPGTCLLACAAGVAMLRTVRNIR